VPGQAPEPSQRGTAPQGVQPGTPQPQGAPQQAAAPRPEPVRPGAPAPDGPPREAQAPHSLPRPAAPGGEAIGPFTVDPRQRQPDSASQPPRES